MPLYANPGIDLIEKTHRILTHTWRAGTCTGGGSTAFADTARTEADDYFQNTVPQSVVRIYATTDGAAPKGQERLVTDWVNSSGTGTVGAAWTTANPASGDKYAILSEYGWDEILAAINDAIEMVRRKALIERADESIVIVSDVYEYDVPSGFLYIYRISESNDSGQYPELIPSDQYRIVRGMPTPRLHFKRFPTVDVPEGLYYSDYWASDWTAGHYLRVEGLAMQDLLEKDTDICYLDPAYVANQAAALLHMRRATAAGTDPTDHKSRAGICQSIADAARPQAYSYRPPDTKRVM